MESLVLHFLVLFPTISILSYFLISDKFPEPKKLIFYTFLFGLIMTFLVGLIKGILYLFISQQGPFFTAFLDAAFIEELGKFLVLYLFCVRFTHFNEPMDGIVYGTVVSLSFATYENYEYVFRSDEFVMNYVTGYVRALSAVPMHAFCGVVMGFFIGKHFFRSKNEKSYLGLALIIPILFHGFYNYSLMENDLSQYFNLVILAILTGVTIFLHNNLKKTQMNKNKEEELKRY